METEFLGRVPFARALEAQQRAVRRGFDHIIGFESESVVTLGLRAREEDLRRAELTRHGVEAVRVDRGGQATLHNPGQLVIFPVCALGPLGSRAWVERLIAATEDLARSVGQTLSYDSSAPGLYDADGAKVASVGVRVRRGVSTHGLAINVRNDLTAFGLIRACGVANARLAHLRTDLSLEALFTRWVACFRDRHGANEARR